MKQRTYLRKHRPDLDKVARNAFMAALGIFDAATDDADLGLHPRERQHDAHRQLAGHPARDRLDLHSQDGGLKVERAYYEWRTSLGSVGVPQETAPLEARADGA